MQLNWNTIGIDEERSYAILRQLTQRLGDGWLAMRFCWPRPTAC